MDRIPGVSSVSRYRTLFLCTDGDLHNLIAIGQLPTFIRSVFQAEFDRLSDVPQSLFPSPALTDTTWNHGALSDQVTVLSG